MILKPIARPVRIRIVSGEMEHSSLASLRANFSLLDLIEPFKDGRLSNWLIQNNNEDLAKKLSCLSDLETKEERMLFCELFEVPFSPDYCVDKYDILKSMYEEEFPNEKKDTPKHFIRTARLLHGLFTSRGESTESSVISKEEKNVMVSSENIKKWIKRFDAAKSFVVPEKEGEIEKLLVKLYIDSKDEALLQDAILWAKENRDKNDYARDILRKYYKLEFIDLGLSVKWASCNLGARFPDEIGDLYRWGEIEPTSINPNCSTMGCGYRRLQNEGVIDYDLDLRAAHDAANVNLGGSARIPRRYNIEELINKCEWEWKGINNLDGFFVEGWVVTGPNGKSIFLPYNKGSYWCSRADGGYADYAYSMSLDSYRSVGSNCHKTEEMPIRPVSD